MTNRFVRRHLTQIDRARLGGKAPDGVDSRWGSERMLYLAGFGICGPNLELDAVDAIVATWKGTVYQGG